MYELPPLPARRNKRKPYKKPASVIELEQVLWEASCRKYPNVDPKYIAHFTRRDDTANGLTRCVIDYIRLIGGQAERINCTGRYHDNTKVFTDVVGRARSIGTGQWLPTSGMKGSADISATIRGRSVKIEIKIHDRQSEAQKEYERQITNAGGIYKIIRSFTECKEFLDTLN